jgi:hypothetical protein
MNKQARNHRNKEIKKYYGDKVFEATWDEQIFSYDQGALNSLYYNIPTPINSLDCIPMVCNIEPPSTALTRKQMCKAIVNEENEEMNTTTSNDFATQRRHLDQVMYTSKEKHRDSLAAKYHVKPVRPKTVQEYVDWIKEGKWSLKPGYEGYTTSEIYIEPYEHLANFIRWSSEKTDQKGYVEAEKKLFKEYDDIQLRVKIKDPQEVLKEVEAFRDSKMYH